VRTALQAFLSVFCRMASLVIPPDYDSERTAADRVVEVSSFSTKLEVIVFSFCILRYKLALRFRLEAFSFSPVSHSDTSNNYSKRDTNRFLHVTLDLSVTHSSTSFFGWWTAT
jgi:hypothetical protein